MCLLLVAYRVHPEYPLIVAANRDEFHQRPSAPAQWWDAGILAGRDLRGGGTWLGLTRQGRFAVVTNYREGIAEAGGRPSRGQLVRELLERGAGGDCLPWLREVGPAYNGFNLVFGGVDGLYSFSSRSDDEATLAPGLYGLSNHLLETPWPKVQLGKQRLQAYLDEGRAPALEPLLELLGDRSRPADAELPRTGISLEWERLLSSLFIVSPEYGTRASTAVVVAGDGTVRFAERRFGPDGEPLGSAEFHFGAAP